MADGEGKNPNVGIPLPRRSLLNYLLGATVIVAIRGAINTLVRYLWPTEEIIAGEKPRELPYCPYRKYLWEAPRRCGIREDPTSLSGKRQRCMPSMPSSPIWECHLHPFGMHRLLGFFD